MMKIKKPDLKKILIPLFVAGIFLIFFGSLNFKNNSTKIIPPKIVSQDLEKSKPKEASSSAKKEASKSAYVPIFTTPKINSSGVPILYYHYIANNPNPKDTQRDALSVPPDKFDEQMNYLSQNGFTPISLDTLFGIYNAQVKMSKPIVLTFDDGYIDFYTNVFPILRKYGFHAVSFIPTGLIGGGYYMNWDQIKEIQSSGLVTFEDHTINHVNLTAMSDEAISKQIVDSRNILFSETGYPVNFIAYPYGITDGRVETIAKGAGYIGGLGTWFGKASFGSMNMPRIKVSGFWDIKEFASRL